LDLLSWAERFVATPSVSHEGNRAIAACAAELLQEAGLEARIETVTVRGSKHRVVISDRVRPGGASDAEGLLLVTHLDTVPPGDVSAWTATGGDPFRPTRDSDRLYGLGSADAKVDFVCKVAALADIDPRQLQRPVRIVGTFGEEIGLLGTKWLVDSGKTEGFRYALVRGAPPAPEPSHATPLPRRAHPPERGLRTLEHTTLGSERH
jgi:succinyl-diaminopimelate desuccinylase